MNDADRRTLQRFVAGLDVDADALATAITARALEATIVDEALLQSLASDETVVRRRTARRIAGMDILAPRVAARLRVVAESDADERTRAAAAAALLAHTPPPDPDPDLDPGPVWNVLAALRLQPVAVRWRGEPRELEFKPLVTSEAPYAGGALVVVDGIIRLELGGLPAAFAGRLPAVLVDDELLATASTPVVDGDVTIDFPAEAGTFDELAARLALFEVVVLDT